MIFPFFISKKSEDTLPITDKRMTRFMITLEQSVRLVWHAFDDMVGGEIYIKKIPSMKVTDIAHSVNPNARLEFIGIRPGEKLHEEMISKEDSLYTYAYDDYFKILPNINKWSKSKDRIKEGEKVEENFSYTSENNQAWMSAEDLREWINTNKKKIGNI